MNVSSEKKNHRSIKDPASLGRCAVIGIIILGLAVEAPLAARPGELPGAESVEAETTTRPAKPPEPATTERAAKEDTETAPTEGAEDTMEIDEAGSVEEEAHDAPESAAAKQRLRVRGDLRARASDTHSDERDGTRSNSDLVTGRLRIGARWAATPHVRLSGRVAGTCTSNDCLKGFTMDGSLESNASVQDGTWTFDELFVHWFQTDRFDVAVGRLQTKFPTLGGVINRSLDRNDSNNTTINWTDGAHGTLRADNGWVGHLIIQRNLSSGATNLRHAPLDFRDDRSRLTYFAAFENREALGPFVQRGFDVSFLRQSLLENGTAAGSRSNYWGFVGRAAARFPQRGEGRRLRLAGELGYAPVRPRRAAVKLPGSGDADGLAWAVTASLIDFFPGHSVGLNYARAEGGWLISPQYAPNQELMEVRYQWRARPKLALEGRVRWRRDLVQEIGATRKLKKLDAFVRITWSFDVY